MDREARQIDQQLLPLINAASEAESEAALEHLICNQAQPLIKDIVTYKLRASSSVRSAPDGQDVEDVSSEVILRLVNALREFKSTPVQKPISNLRSYVAVMAYNASDAYLRKKYPKRFSLKNKIKYLLTHHAGLALWEDDGNVLCGLSSDREIKQLRPARNLTDRLSEMRDFLRRRAVRGKLESMSPGEQLSGICEFAGSPIEIDDLVTVMAEFWGIRDSVSSEQGPGLRQLDEVSDPAQPFDAVLDQRAKIRLVWEQTIQLPLRQRMALLLNLRDEQGGSALAMLPILRIASLAQIAEVLEMSEEDLAKLWNELPIEDAVIGKRIGATRQQVSNLRKCARERLFRKLESIGE